MTDRDPRYEYRHGAPFYDGFTPYRNRPDIRFYIEEATRSGGPVLELGCGTGRILIPAARAGVEMTGVDLSADMLAECRRALATEPDDVRQRVTLHEGDMRSFDLVRTFSLVTIPFRPFQHLIEVDEQLACLKCIRDHLAPGGALIFDVFFPSLHYLVDDARLEPNRIGEPYTLPDGRVVTRYDHIVSRDLHRQVQQVRLIYDVRHSDGRVERLADEFPMRYFFRWELEHPLNRAGFTVEQMYSDFDRTPFGDVYPGEMIVIARPAA